MSSYKPLQDCLQLWKVGHWSSGREEPTLPGLGSQLMTPSLGHLATCFSCPPHLDSNGMRWRHGRWGDQEKSLAPHFSAAFVFVSHGDTPPLCPGLDEAPPFPSACSSRCNVLCLSIKQTPPMATPHSSFSALRLPATISHFVTSCHRTPSGSYRFCFLFDV